MQEVFFQRYDQLLESDVIADIKQSQNMGHKRRKEFLKGRYMLRTHAANIIDCNYSSIELGNCGGRLEVLAPIKMSCSLAHTQGWFACVLADYLVGIDIELVNRDINILRVAKRYFHEREYAWIIASENPEYSAKKLWILKEAYVKLNSSTLARELGKVCFDANFGLSEYNIKFYERCGFIAATIHKNNLKSLI